MKEVLLYMMEVHSPYTVAALSRKPKGVRGEEFAGFGLRWSMRKRKRRRRRVCHVQRRDGGGNEQKDGGAGGR